MGEWEKVLWRKQAYPDNYIPPQAFLSSLRKNPHFKPYTYWALVLSSCAIAQHIASIYIFLAVFIRLYKWSLDPRILVWISIACFTTGYPLWELLDRSPLRSLERQAIRARALKSSILVLLGLMSLTPVLKTLTASTSSDTIWASSACLFILNALLADYSSVEWNGKSRQRLTPTLSLNAAISASVVLASRLRTDLEVFALILFSVQLFALFPNLRTRLQTASSTLNVILTFIVSAFAIILTVPLSRTASYIYTASLILVTFISPGILIWAQRYKNEIRGPWDVAVPKVN